MACSVAVKLTEHLKTVVSAFRFSAGPLSIVSHKSCNKKGNQICGAQNRERGGRLRSHPNPSSLGKGDVLQIQFGAALHIPCHANVGIVNQ